MKRKKHISEFKRLHITKTELLNSKNIVQYRINGIIYSFAIPESESYEETPYAYCTKRNKWAWLYPNSVYFKDEFMVPAERI